MNVYKLGIRWGAGKPNFYNLIKEQKISLSHASDCHPEKGSVILITDGHTVLALTVLLEDMYSVIDRPELEELFDKYEIDFDEDVLVANSTWIELEPSERFYYKLQDGICQVHKPEIIDRTKSLLKAHMDKQEIEKNLKILRYKKQIILQGPPGTGKTKLAKELAADMLGLEGTKDLKDHPQFSLIQFHPSYTYEDFVRGITAKPNGDKGGILYEAENKLLGSLAEKAVKDKENSYVLIIDEINRANLSSVLGELIYALEYRDEDVDSMYAVGEKGNQLRLPSNLYIIGTMNTADRSVGHIDYAIRRRFAFVDVLPEALQDDDKIWFNTTGFEGVKALFNSENVSSEFDAKDVQIGHSYFIAKKSDALMKAERDAIFAMKMEYEVVPILREYVRDGILTGTIEGKPVSEYINGLTEKE